MSVAVTAGGDLVDQREVLRSPGVALRLLCHRLALWRRRRQELLQPALCHVRGLELCCGGRRLRIQRRDHLRIAAGGVDCRTQIGVCGRDPRASEHRQCQTPGYGSQFAQRTRDHMWDTFQVMKRRTSTPRTRVYRKDSAGGFAEVPATSAEASRAHPTTPCHRYFLGMAERPVRNPAVDFYRVSGVVLIVLGHWLTGAGAFR